MNANLKRERKSMIKIAEKYSNEAEELLKNEDDAIENLEKQNVIL